MNMQLFRWINRLAGKSGMLDAVMIFFSKYMIVIFVSILVLLYILGFVEHDANQRKSAISAALFTVINLGLAALISAVFYIPRPFVHNKVNLLYPHVPDSSFPSDHATATMSIALGLWKGKRKISLALIILSLIVGFSRIFVGHHTPADILGSYSNILIMNFAYNYLLRSRVERTYERMEKWAAVHLRPSKNAY